METKFVNTLPIDTTENSTMNKSIKHSQPTNSELSILNVLWRLGEGSVREIHEELNRERETGYTTVLKLLQIMTEKGLVVRDESSRAHIYRAKESTETSQRGIVDDLVDRVFGGSSQKLVMHALSSQRATPEELAEIRSLLNELEKSEKKETS